jgi:tryptophan synthase beta subunit
VHAGQHGIESSLSAANLVSEVEIACQVKERIMQKNNPFHLAEMLSGLHRGAIIPWTQNPFIASLWGTDGCR